MKNLLITLMYISVFTFSSCDLFSGKDNKMVNKIWKNQFPCNEELSKGMFSLYDTEKNNMIRRTNIDYSCVKVA